MYTIVTSALFRMRKYKRPIIRSGPINLITLSNMDVLDHKMLQHTFFSYYNHVCLLEIIIFLLDTSSKDVLSG